MSAEPPPGPTPGSSISGVTRSLPDGSSYAFRPDPDYPGLVQLVVRSPGGAGGAGEGSGRFGRDQLRNLISDATAIGGLRQTSPAIERSAMAGMLAGAMRRNLELIRELWSKDPLAAETLVKALLDDLKSWQPSMAPGSLVP